MKYNFDWDSEAKLGQDFEVQVQLLQICVRTCLKKQNATLRSFVPLAMFWNVRYWSNQESNTSSKFLQVECIFGTLDQIASFFWLIGPARRDKDKDKDCTSFD